MLLSQVCREKPHIAFITWHECVYKLNYLNKYSTDPATSCSLYGIYCVFIPGMLKIHSGGPSSQQTVLTIPANQLKQLGVGTGSGGLQTIIMPVGKGKHARDSSLLTCLVSTITLFTSSFEVSFITITKNVHYRLCTTSKT